MIEEINNMIQVIKDCPELFHDGIDEEILSLLLKIKKYLSGRQKNE